MTLDRMLERAVQTSPEKFAILSRTQTLTYRQLNNQVNSLANGLLNMGLKRGDRVAMLLPKSAEAIVAFLGVTRAGGIIAPINMRLKTDTLRVTFNHLRPFAVIADPLYNPLLVKLCKSSSQPCRAILTGKMRRAEALNSISAESLEYLFNKESERFTGVPLDEKDPAYLNYTSGTTGIPKGALTTHGNLMWNTRGAVEILKMDARDVHMCMFPMYAHPHEIFCRSIYLGGTTVLLDSMYPKTIARAIEQYHVTCVMAVPPFFRSLFPLGRSHEFDFSSLRIPEAGGVYSPPELCKEFEDIFNLRFLPVWGSTETTGIALATSPVEDHLPGSLGKPCPGYEVQVLSPGGRQAGQGEAGEMVVSGPGVVSGYLDHPTETEASFHNGAWHTGDMVRQDENGYFHFLGRRSGLMKVAGLKVYPSEVETVLQSHPQVEEAAVIALPDTLRGEVPKAFVVLKPEKLGQKPIPAAEFVKDLRNFCRQHLADYKVPSLIELRPVLPRTEAGKISHAELAREALDALADDEVNSLQRRVHEVDSKLVELLNARLELIHRIISLTERTDQPVYTALRGDEVIAHIIEENKGPIYDEALEEIFRKILSLDLML
jgi:long-chain acyl-CoA synthetase